MLLEDVLGEQAGLVTRAQLRALGVSRAYERSQLDASRWRALNDAVICTHNGPLTRLQAMWVVVLGARPPVGLAGLTVLERLGVKGLRDPAIHVLVAKGSRPIDTPEVPTVIHESRRFTAIDVLPRLPPITGLERATVDAACWSPDIKTATRVLVAPVQQRFTTAARLRDALSAAGPIKFRSVLVPFVADLEGGAEALSEVAFLRWCRKHGFPRPRCRARLDSSGETALSRRGVHPRRRNHPSW